MPITTELPETAAIKTGNIDIPSFLELEITGFCQLRCVHCYAESGDPAGRPAHPVRDRPLAGLRQRPRHAAGRPAVRPGLAAYANCRASPC